MVIANRTNGHNGTYSPYAPESERQVGLSPDERLKFADYVKTLFENSRQYFHTFQSQCRKAEDYYFQRNNVPVPEVMGTEMAAVNPAKARSIINIATDHVDVNNIAIDVPSSPRAKARAEKLKKFYQGVWLNVKGPVLRTAVKHAFTYGIGWLKPMFNADQWPDSPTIDQYTDADGEVDDEAYTVAVARFLEERAIKFPIVVKNVNPKNLIWDDSRARRQWVIEYYEREVRDVKKRYPEWNTALGGMDMTTWMEYWDDKYCGYMADGQWVWGPYEHSYGFLPYVPIMPANSIDWDTGKIHERYQGLLQPIYSLLDAHARIVTAYEAILRGVAWQTLDFTGPAHLVEEARSNYEIFGSFNALPTGVTVASSPRVVPPSELLQYLNVIETLIEEATFPNVIRGVRPRGVSSGFGLSVLSGMGRLVFQGVADGAARAVEQLNSGFAQLVENRIRGKVTVFARTEVHNFDQTIGPEDIKGLYENRVLMKAEAPEEREREALLGLKLFQAGIISLYEAQRRAGLVNPLEEQIQIRAEQLLNSPEMLAAQAQIAAEGVGLLNQLGQSAGVNPQLPGQENRGNEFVGLGQGPRPGEAGIQQQRLESRGVLPSGLGQIDRLGGNLGTPNGAPTSMPSGQTVRRGG
jgi:hypothetical protein